MTGSRIRILCVEDHTDTSNMLAFWMGKSGYEFVPALTYAEGLHQVSPDDFDAYLIDNRLPDGQGLALCKEIREHDSKTPIIFYSADAQAYTIQAAYAAGANEYLVKPVSLEKLDEVISQLIH